MNNEELKTLKDLEYKYKNVMSEIVGSGKVEIKELKAEAVKIYLSDFDALEKLFDFKIGKRDKWVIQRVVAVLNNITEEDLK